MFKLIITLLLGFLFGSVLISSQVFSWYQIQDMFHFRSFHMFGVLFSAIATASVFIYIFKKQKQVSIYGNKIEIKTKKLAWRANSIGGLIFGIGWSISGACSAPIYILVGLEWKIGILLLIGAFVGTVFFGLVEHKLPK